MTTPRQDRPSPPPAARRRRRPDGADAAARRGRPPRPMALRDLHAYYGDDHAVQGVDARLRGQPGHGDDRPVGLRQVDAAALHQPHARGDPRRARRGHDRARRRRHLRHGRRRRPPSAARSAWSSRSPTRSRRCRSSTTSPPGLRLTGRKRLGPQGARRALAARRRAVGRGQGPPRQARASACPAASSSACASRARSRSSPR